MILANYTPDDIKYVHGGIPGIIKSGEMTDMPESKANFLFNKFDQRGLLKLQFGDDPEEKKAEAMKIYKEFWVRQVTVHNQANEKRQARNLEYSAPTPEVATHAKDLGLKILGPWTASMDESGEMAQLRNDNADLRVQVNTLSSQLSNLITAINSQMGEGGVKLPEQQFPAVSTAPEPDPEKEDAAVEKEIQEKEELAAEATEALSEAEEELKKGPDENVVMALEGLTNEQLAEWVMKNATPIMNEYNYPTQAFVKETWDKICDKETWPLPV